MATKKTTAPKVSKKKTEKSEAPKSGFSYRYLNDKQQPVTGVVNTEAEAKEITSRQGHSLGSYQPCTF